MTHYSGSRAKRGKQFKFIPTEKQIETAKRRILCTLNKHDGQTPVRSFNDAVDFLCKEVYNRGGELGTYADRQFKTTIRTALHQLIDSGDVLLDMERGLIILATAVETNRRPHQQKYPKGMRLRYA